MAYRNKHSKILHLLFATLIRELVDTPSDAQDLADVTGLTVDTVRLILRHLHDKKLIHIAEWRITTGVSRSRVFAWGTGKDAVRPKMTRTEYKRRYRQRLRDEKPKQRLDTWLQPMQ